MGFAVPVEHGVDCFGQFGGAGFVDAACIDPGVLKPFLPGLVTASQKFPVASHDLVMLGRACQILEGDLSLSLGMRQDGVGKPFETLMGDLELRSFKAEESHCSRLP